MRGDERRSDGMVEVSNAAPSALTRHYQNNTATVYAATLGLSQGGKAKTDCLSRFVAKTFILHD